MAGADRPFVDGPPGPLTATTELAGEAARRWRLPTPELVRVGMNAIFAAGAVVLRVSRPTAPPEAALGLAAVLSAAGVHVARPARDDAVHGPDGMAVTAWERLDGVDAPVDWHAVGEMVAVVHALAPDDLPVAYPRPRCDTFPWWRFDLVLPEVADLLDGDARAGIVAAIDRHAGWTRSPDRVVSHGDVHPGNVVVTATGPVLIDWDLLCLGPAAWDHAMLIRVTRWGGSAQWYEDFAAGYGRSLADDPVAVDIAELRLVAATLMRLRAARADPAAMPEAQRRLAYWRGDPDAPTWSAV